VIRVCVVEDQALVRQGIASLLALTPDIRVVAEAADGDEAIDAIPRSRADVVLLDIRMPKRSGTEVVKALADADRLPPTLLLTTFDDDEALIRGILAGARGFLMKDVTLEQLADAIRTLAAGGSMIHPAASARIAKGLIGRRPDGGPPEGGLYVPEALSPREREVLRLMAAGYSNREIGQLLEMVEGTVKNHVSNILSKLGVRDRTRAVLKAFELGWL
jgi:DNA-binding NarL/FixJ family response regulator